MKINSEYGKIILRISLSLVFLWFGISQLYSPGSWSGFIPAFLTALLPAKTFVLINGAIEVILGLMLLSGLYVRFASLILGLHLLGIAFTMGYNAVAIRDVGLGLATLAILFNGYDKWCLSSKGKALKDNPDESSS